MADEQHPDGLKFPIHPVDPEKLAEFKEEAQALLHTVMDHIENVNFLKFAAEVSEADLQSKILDQANLFVNVVHGRDRGELVAAIPALAYALATITLCHKGGYQEFKALTTMMWVSANRDLIKSGMELPPPPEDVRWDK